MRKISGVVFTIFLVLNLNGQKKIDSLQRLLLLANQDTIRINLLNLIAGTYRESQPDSNLKYANEALILSRNFNYREGEIDAMRNLSNAFLMAGDYPRALETALNALKKSEALGDKQLIARCLNVLGRVYSEQGDNEQAQVYGRKTMEIYEEINDKANPAIILVNMGFGYNQLNQLDSSRIYLNRSLDISLPMNLQGTIAGAYLNLGLLYTKMKQYEIASAYCRQAIPNFTSTSNYSFLYSSYYLLMPFSFPCSSFLFYCWVGEK